MITILVAPDKFKGTLSASEAADIIADSLSPLDAKIIKRPMADGGEGTSEALSRLITLKSKQIAAIDSSSALGLSLLSQDAPSVMHRSSYPLGEAVLSIIRKEAPTLLYIGVGGTSTVDGGAGFLQALGYRFFDGDDELPSPITASMLSSVTRILPPAPSPALPRIIALCDVAVPLIAPEGEPSSLTFAPQKGATPADIVTLRHSLHHLSSLLPPTGSPYDGAGGGLGYALAQIGAEMTAGAPYLLKLMDIPALNPDLIITGEGSLDAQTSMGKVVAALARYGSTHNVPVVAVGGKVSPGFSLQGLSAAFSTQHYPPQGCLNYHTARARLSSAVHSIRAWIERRIDNLSAKP